MIVQLWDMLKQNAPFAALLVLILSFVIQITPIKINPWSPILKKMGKLMTGEACGKMDILISRVKDIEQKVVENEKDRIRWEILDFANSCRNGRKHTKDEFQHILTLNTKYKRLLEQTNDANGVFEVEIEYIKRIYAERLEKNDFLA